MKEDASFAWDNFPSLESTTLFLQEVFERYCNQDSRILDIGCGYGRICKILEDRDYRRLFGVDRSLTQLRRAKETLQHTVLCYADACQLPFAESSFGHAITLGLINCLTVIEELDALIEECCRVLRPDGYWFINIYTRNSSTYFDNKYREGMNRYGEKRVFDAKSGLRFKHYSIAEFIMHADPCFDLVLCQGKQFLSMNHTHPVSGYSLVLRKPTFISEFR